MILSLTNTVGRGQNRVVGPVGPINSESAWANLNDFTVVGNGTPVISIVSNKLNMTGGTGGTLFTNYIGFSKATSPFHHTCLENWRQRVTCTTPSSLTATSYGFGIGIKSTNVTGDTSTYIRWSWDTGDNRVYFYVTGSVTGQTISAGSVVPTANTTYVIDVLRAKNVVTVTLYQADGVTQLLQTSFTMGLTFPANGQIMHNTGRFTLQNFGGTNLTISQWAITSTANRNAAYIAVGDSNMYGLFAGTNAVRYTQQAMTATNKTFEIVAGYADHTADVLNRIDEIKYLSPSAVYLNIGSNDVADGVGTGTWQANIDSIISQLQTAGIVVKLGTPIARATDLTAVQTYINGKANTKVDLFAATKDGVNHLLAAYDSGDTVHMNVAGHNACSTALQAIL